MKWLLALSAASLLMALAGCPEDDGDDDSASGDDDTADTAQPLDLAADSDRDGTVDASAEEDAVEDAFPGAVVRVDVDDDNSDATLDCDADGICDEENDLALVLALGNEVPDAAVLSLMLDGDVALVRVWLDGEPILGAVGEDTITEVDVDDFSLGDLDLDVQGLDFNVSVTLSASLSDGGEVLGEDSVALNTAPFMMFNHLDPARMLYVLDDGNGNRLMRDGIKDAIGEENVYELAAMQYQWDVWLQDEIEFGYQQSPVGAMDLVLDSIRADSGAWTGLDPFPENELIGPDFGHLVRGSGFAQSVDSFGNLECSPPLTADGTDYPFGRIYYGGRSGTRQVTQALRTFLDAQEVQSPVEFDSVWLAVGHVDEFMLFLPDPDSAKGFKLGYTDCNLAIEILESLDPRMAVPRHDVHGYTTVGELLEESVIDYSLDLQVQYMDPILELVKEAFGLEESDIIYIPGLWEEAYGAGLAVIPGMTNLAVYDEHLLIADPFLRTPDEDVDGDGVTDFGEDINGNGELDTDEDANGNRVLDPGEDVNGNGVLDTEEDLDEDWQLDDGEDLNGDGLLNTYRDPFIAHFEESLPAYLVPHFLDNWNDYHLMWGEVHCGTNILRTPRSDLYWWEVE